MEDQHLHMVGEMPCVRLLKYTLKGYDYIMHTYVQLPSQTGVKPFQTPFTALPSPLHCRS